MNWFEKLSKKIIQDNSIGLESDFIKLCDSTINKIWLTDKAVKLNNRWFPLSVLALDENGFVWVQVWYYNNECKNRKSRKKHKNLIDFELEKNSGKITNEGQPCKKCKTPVVKQVHKKTKPNKKYWFLYWFKCPKCRTIYFVEEAKVFERPFTQKELKERRDKLKK